MAVCTTTYLFLFLRIQGVQGDLSKDTKGEEWSFGGIRGIGYSNVPKIRKGKGASRKLAERGRKTQRGWQNVPTSPLSSSDQHFPYPRLNDLFKKKFLLLFRNTIPAPLFPPFLPRLPPLSNHNLQAPSRKKKTEKKQDLKNSESRYRLPPPPLCVTHTKELKGEGRRKRDLSINHFPSVHPSVRPSAKEKKKKSIPRIRFTPSPPLALTSREV